jgi:hypothetical protein
VRQEKCKPLVLALKTWLEQQLARVSTKSVIAEVIRYGLNHWDGLAVKSQRTPTPFFASKNDPSDGAETGAADRTPH